MHPVKAPARSASIRNMLSLAVAIAIGGTAGWSVGSPIDVRIVALSGQAMPDYTGSTATAGDTVFGQASPVTSSAFSNMAINNSGLVAFQSIVTGTSVVTSGVTQNNGGVFTEGSGSLKLIARRAGFVPDASGAPLGDLNYTTTIVGPNISASGQTAIVGTVRGTGVVTTGATANNNVIVQDNGGTQTLQVRKLDPAPGTTQFFYGTGGPPVMNPTGTIAFASQLSNGTTLTASSAGIWTLKNSVATKIAAIGDTAPGTDIGSGLATFSGSSFANPVINAAGGVAFLAGLTTGSNGVVSGTNQNGIWSTAGGNLTLVARFGDVAPGTSGGAFGTSLTNQFGYNNHGVVAFAASLNAGTGDVTTNNNAAIFKGVSEPTLSIVARKGNAAPGTVTGVTYSAFGTVVVNKNDFVAFHSTLTGTGITASLNDTAIFTETATGVSLVARAGDAAPGGNFFRSFSSSAAIQTNALGHVAFLNTLATTVGGATAETGLFAQDTDGLLTLVAKTGQTFQVAPGDVRTISALSYGSISSLSSGGEDGRVMSWNDASQLVYTLYFTDGTSGVFTATVPEPTLATGLIAASGLLLRRKRQTASH